MERLKEERGIAYLYITHDIASARYIGDETIVMYAGRMVEGAESDELIHHPAHPYTQLLLSAVPNPRAATSRATTAARCQPPGLIDPPRGAPSLAAARTSWTSAGRSCPASRRSRRDIGFAATSLEVAVLRE